MHYSLALHASQKKKVLHYVIKMGSSFQRIQKVGKKWDAENCVLKVTGAKLPCHYYVNFHKSPYHIGTYSTNYKNWNTITTAANLRLNCPQLYLQHLLSVQHLAYLHKKKEINLTDKKIRRAENIGKDFSEEYKHKWTVNWCRTQSS